MRVGEAGVRDGSIALRAAAPVDAAGTEVQERSATKPAEGPSPFARILHGLGREMDRGEHLVQSAIQGGESRDLGGGALLALQAGVYRYSEAVDLSAKLVDRAASGVKTVLQGQ